MILTFKYNDKARRVGVIKLDDTVIQGILLNEIQENTEGLESLVNYFNSIPCSFIEDKEKSTPDKQVSKPFIDISGRRDFDLKPFYPYFRKFNLSKLSKADLLEILIQLSPKEAKEEKGKEEEKPKKAVWKFEDGTEEVIDKPNS